MISVKREIPEAVKLAARQHARFGCVLCGMPVFHYDHIEEFADVLEHLPENIALLCPNHHQDKTSGRIGKERIKQAHANPFNRNRWLTAVHRITSSLTLKAQLGSNYFIIDKCPDDFSLIWINGISFVTIHYKNDEYSFSAKITDEFGNTLLSIDHGELVVATRIWDYRYEGTKVTIRQGQGDILFEGEMSDTIFKVCRGHFVDRFNTGIRIDQNGKLLWTMSGLEVGSSACSSFGASLVGIALIRGSCHPVDEKPQGAGIIRTWLPEYEMKAEQMRQQLESGVLGKSPPGLAKFRSITEG